jgi:hypothetical protein
MLSSEVNLKSLTTVALLISVLYVFFRRHQNQQVSVLLESSLVAQY